MKQSFPWIVLSLYCFFGVGLLIRLAIETPVHVIQQKSEYAIINVSDPEIADAIANGKIKIQTGNPNAKTLLRVTSGTPTRITGKVSSEGNIQVINPAGIIIGNGEPISQFGSRSTSTKAEIIPHGNIYALAIREGGAIRANRSVEISTSFEYDFLEGNRVDLPTNTVDPSPPIDDR